MENSSEEGTDWFQWLGIEPSEKQRIYSHAKKLGIPVLEGDSARDIYDRIQSLKSFKDTRRMMLITLASTCVAIVSAVAAVWGLFR